MPNQPIPIPRFAWTVSPFDLKDLPERYRTLYGFAAATLNLSTSLWALASFLSEPNDLTRAYAGAILDEGRLGSIQPPRRDGMQALRQSMLAARELFLLCQEAAAVKPPLLKRDKRFPKYFLTTRDGSALSQFEFKDFVVGEVQESAMSLIAGELQLQGQAVVPAPSQPSPSEDQADTGADFPQILRRQILDGAVPDRHAIVAWLIAHSKNYRVRFNLGCYFSREIIAPTGQDDQSQEVWVERSLEQLYAALALCPPDRRSSVAQQTTTDPALVGLRLRGPIAFNDFLVAAGVTWEPDTPPTTGDPELDNIELRGQILATLVPDRTDASRLRTLLSRMYPPSGRMDRSALLDPHDWSITQVEEYLAADQADSFGEKGDLYRETLARILFLPRWNRISSTYSPTDTTLDAGGQPTNGQTDRAGDE